MFSWRITKYNPIYRNELGAYLKEEWTSISDIGKSFDGKQLTFKQYLKIENAYIEAILAFMDCLEIKTLCVAYLEKHTEEPRDKEHCSQSMLKIYDNIKVSMQADHQEIADIARLVLRENLWCKLENENMYVHFGYDYYMYIGASKPCKTAIEKIEKTGLFVEPFESPYLEEID